MEREMYEGYQSPAVTVVNLEDRGVISTSTQVGNPFENNEEVDW